MAELDYLWWVIPSLLGGMPKPPLQDLPLLHQAGVRGIISLLDQPSLIPIYQDAGFDALALPIQEEKPPSPNQVRELVQFTDPILARSQAVAIHCSGGNHRTGTMLAAYLIAKGQDPQLVISRIKAIHPTADLPELQKQFLLELPLLLS